MVGATQCESDRKMTNGLVVQVSSYTYDWVKMKLLYALVNTERRDSGRRLELEKCGSVLQVTCNAKMMFSSESE